jgi:hypothetical protein
MHVGAVDDDEMIAELERELTLTHQRLAEARHEAKALAVDVESLRTTVRLVEEEARVVAPQGKRTPYRNQGFVNTPACAPTVAGFQVDDDAVMVALLDTRTRLAAQLDRARCRREEIARLLERLAYIEGTGP